MNISSNSEGLIGSVKDKLKLNTAADFYRRWEDLLKPCLISALSVCVGFAVLCLLLIWLWKPATDDGGSNLGSVLEAQAAMTAIFLAAMIFIVEAVQRRERLDDPLYELFLSKSWARLVFAAAVALLVGTALVYLLGPITGWVGLLDHPRGDVLGIVSLVAAAVLVLLFLLNALRVLRPEQYRPYRQEAVLDQVRRGARSQVQARSSPSSSERIRQITGVMNDPETQAARAIERAADHAHQAVERAQLTEIREGMELLELICSTIREELEDGGYEMPEIGGVGDQRWFGHDNILSGMQRMLLTAGNSPASESVLWAIFRADLQKAQSSLGTPYRLGENITSGNDLFVQVMLECVQSERKLVARLADTELSFRFRSPQEEMLSDALLRALGRGIATAGGARGDRLARRVIAVIHSSASRAALGSREVQGDGKQACALLEMFLRYLEATILASEEAPEGSDELRRALRQATLSAIGYGVGIGNHDFLNVAARQLHLDDLAETGQKRHLYSLIDHDVNQPNGGEPILSAGLLFLSTSIAPHPTPPESEDDVQKAELVCVILGYMWLLGMIHDGAGDLELPDTVKSEFARVWSIHGAHLVSAFHSAGVGGGGSLRNWCKAAFASRGDDSND